MKNSLFGKASLFVAVGLLSAGAAFAQTMTQGGIAGTVEDSTGAAVPDAAILIHNNGTGNNTNVKSGGSGEYTAPLLPPGSYTVTISAAGFSTEKANVTVLVNQLTDVNPHLKTGAASETVEVSSDIPTIQLDTPAFGGHLENREIENIPINNRRWSSLALTTPGVTNTQDGFGLLSFRGIPGVLNNVQIDGVDDNQGFFGEERGRTRAGYSTSQAAVREFQVNTGVYSAELGRAVGGVVNSVTKTGGNQMHGEVYFYHRNDETSSKNPKVTLPSPVAGGQPVPFRPKDKRNQYGFAAGGSLIKDKLFWFYAFDVFARQFPGTAVSGAPLVLAQTCTPVTTVNGVTTGNASYASLIAATGATQAQCASALADLQGDLGIVPRFGDQEINTPKLTWQINPKNTLDVYYHRLRWDSPGGVQTQAAVSYAVDSFGTDFVKLDYGVGKLNSLITDHLTNELRYQYARELNDEGQQPFSSYTANHLIGNGGTNATYASIATASGGFNLGSPYYSYRVSYPDERKWQIGDTAAYIYKKHTIRFGVDFLHNYDLQNNVYQSNGSYSYANVSLYLADILKPSGACTAQTSSATPSLSASGTAGCYSSESQGFGPSTFDLSTLDTAYFVQDDWKVAPNFTLNLGIRYDYEALPSPYTSALNPDAPQEANHPSDKNNIAPRIGFAWDPFGDGKTSVRGGFGMYYGRIPNAVLLNAYVNTGTSSANGQAAYTTYNGTNAPATLKFPNILAARPTSAPLLSAQYLDAHMQNPYTEQFDLAIQREIGHGNVLSLSYLGALGKELPNYINTNINPAGAYNVTYTLVAANGNTTCAGRPCGTTFTQKVYNNVTVNPKFLNITDAVSNANSSYSGFVVEIQNRTSKLLSYDVNYTWSHSLDYNVVSTTANGTNNFIDPYDPTSSYGNSLIDVPNRLVGWAIFNLPGTKAHNAVSYVTNGWSFKPLLQVQTGLPYSISLSSGSPNGITTGTGTTAVVQKPISSGISGTGVSTFIPFFGRNNYFAPANIALDARLQKDFHLYSRYELQLFAEGFNLLNHENITAVNTGAYSIVNPNDGTPAKNQVYNGTSQLQTSAPNFFGTPTSSGVNGTYAYQVRQFQFGARVTF